MRACKLALKLAIVGCASIASCRLETNLHQPPPGAPKVAAEHTEIRRKYDNATQKLVHEWTLLFTQDHGAVKDGAEKTWYPNGMREWERALKRGKPDGAWRSWSANGTQRSESFFGDPDVDTTMTFWHPNGQISKQGPARNGLRRGVWKFWYPNGQLAEEGPFIDNKREGTWTAWSEDGQQAVERKYSKNVRVVDSAPVVSAASASKNAAPADATMKSAAPSVPEPIEDIDEPLERPPK